MINYLNTVTMFLGYFNDKVGRQIVYRPTIGKDSLHENSNDNGTRLTNTAMSKELVISSIYSPRRINTSTHGYLQKSNRLCND
jgi:hypothetical protein